MFKSTFWLLRVTSEHFQLLHKNIWRQTCVVAEFFSLFYFYQFDSVFNTLWVDSSDKLACVQLNKGQSFGKVLRCTAKSTWQEAQVMSQHQHRDLRGEAGLRPITPSPLTQPAASHEGVLGAENPFSDSLLFGPQEWRSWTLEGVMCCAESQEHHKRSICHRIRTFNLKPNYEICKNRRTAFVCVCVWWG